MKTKQTIFTAWISYGYFSNFRDYCAEFGGLPSVRIEHAHGKNGKIVRFLVEPQNLREFTNCINSFRKFMRKTHRRQS